MSRLKKALTAILLVFMAMVALRQVAVFEPHPWQIAPWRDTSRVILLTGSAGGGKSRLAAEKINGYMKRYPGAFGIMARKTRDSMTNSTVLFFLTEIVGGDPDVKHFPSKHRFEYKNGSILAYGGMNDEAQREQLRSIGSHGGVDIIWLEEANRFTEDDYQEMLGRLRGTAAPWRQIILSTNPDHDKHWINTRLIQGREAKVYYSSAADNPANPDDYIEILDGLTGVMRLRLRDGLWRRAEGVVYEEWDPKIHVIKPFPIPREWRRFRVIDFGMTNPFVCQWWAQDPDGRLYLYREIYMSGRIVEDHAKGIAGSKGIVELSKGEYIEVTISDHDAEDRATLERYGVPTKPATKDISPGIQAVQARLRPTKLDGRPRLFVFEGVLVETDTKLEKARKPICTQDEFAAYIWPKTTDGKPIKEVPVKDNDHGMDAMRYLVMYVDRDARTPSNKIAGTAKRGSAVEGKDKDKDKVGLGMFGTAKRKKKGGKAA